MFRETTVLALSAIGTVHYFGKCQGNVNANPIVDGDRPPQCQPFEDSERPTSIQPAPEGVERARRGSNRVAFGIYRFVLLMDNAYVDGYVSEKIVDGFLSGTVPIYYGTRQVFDIFNPRAFVYYDPENPQEAIDQISRLEEVPEEYQRILDEPILADGERTIEKYFSFEDGIGNGQLKRRVRQMMGFPIWRTSFISHHFIIKN